MTNLIITLDYPQVWHLGEIKQEAQSSPRGLRIERWGGGWGVNVIKSKQQRTISYACMHAKSLQSCLTLRTPWTVAHQAPLSVGISRQDDWRGLPFLSPGDLPHPRIKSTSLASLYWQVCSLPLAPLQFSSAAQLCPTMRARGLQHTRLSCPSPTPETCSNSCPSSW